MPDGQQRLEMGHLIQRSAVMARRILIIQGHPDTGHNHLCHALGWSYGAGAQVSGHEVRHVYVADLCFPLLRSKAEYEREPLSAEMRSVQEAISWADHLVIIHPLWQGCMPALLKGFFEQVLRPGFAYRLPARGKPGAQLLRGKSARVVITMGMPAPLYRWFFGAPGLRTLRRNILGLCGVAPVRASLFGRVDVDGDGRQQRWIERAFRLGARAA
jgi:putative NADPH-quinone reductase